MHPDDAAIRGLSPDDPVRIFNDLGEVHCPVALTPDIRRGTVSLARPAQDTYNGWTSNALVPDTLTDSAAAPASTMRGWKSRCWDGIDEIGNRKSEIGNRRSESGDRNRRSNRRFGVKI